MKAIQEFASSFLLIISWLIFVVSGYLLYWTCIMPELVIIPFLFSVGLGFLCRYLARIWNRT
jgi:hypothetical protein